ncbi:MAG TPA: head GIN domain-containing protein [Mucilaginibacter sp.]
MKKIYLATLVLLGCITLGGLSSCMFNCVHGSGHVVSEDRKVGDFSRISISGAYKVTLKQDSSLSLKITADDNLLKYIKTVVSDGRLRIYTRRNLCNNGQMTITIGIRKLEELKASGAVEVVSDGAIHTQDLHFKLSGATKITMGLNAANVTTTGSGATELNLKGQATAHNIDLSGVGHVYAFDFVVGSCDIQTSGMGHSEVNVLNSLSVHSSGASEVRYRGNPSSVTNDKSGASSVEKVN